MTDWRHGSLKPLHVSVKYFAAGRTAGPMSWAIRALGREQWVAENWAQPIREAGRETSAAGQETRFFSFPRRSGWLRCYSERLEERLQMSSGWAWVSVKMTVAAVFCAEHALLSVIKDSPSQTGPLGRYRLGSCWLWIVSFSPQPSVGTTFFGFPVWQQLWACPEVQFRWQKSIWRQAWEQFELCSFWCKVWNPGPWCRWLVICEHLSFKCCSQVCYWKSYSKDK